MVVSTQRLVVVSTQRLVPVVVSTQRLVPVVVSTQRLVPRWWSALRQPGARHCVTQLIEAELDSTIVGMACVQLYSCTVQYSSTYLRLPSTYRTYSRVDTDTSVDLVVHTVRPSFIRARNVFFCKNALNRIE